MKSKDYLKNHWKNASVPTIVKFRRKSGELMKFNARRGEYVLTKSELFKYRRLLKNEIKQRIKSSNQYTMAEILDNNIKEWLDE